MKNVAKPVWGSRSGWRSRLYAIWNIILGRSVMFNCWIEFDARGAIGFDKKVYIVAGGFRPRPIPVYASPGNDWFKP